jgi:FkbM family methyltransferase
MTYVGDKLDRFPAVKRVLRSLYRGMVKAPPKPPSPVLDRPTLRACLTARKPVVVEVGANDGFHTQWFLDLRGDAAIYCFEPDPRAVARFKARIGPAARVQLFQLALSNAQGTATFYQSSGGEPGAHEAPAGQDWDASGSIKKPKKHLEKHADIRFDSTLEIETRRLDDWCREAGIEQIDFLWMDVQGAEREVLEGAGDMLERTHFIYTEYSNEELYEGQATLAELLRLLPGFEVLIVYPGDVLLRNKRFAFRPNRELREAIAAHGGADPGSAVSAGAGAGPAGVPRAKPAA